jgi:hypothetical protein
MIACEDRVPPWRDLNVLGIVAKEQISPPCCDGKTEQILRQRIIKISFAVLLLRARVHEFARVSQAIIHGALESKKVPHSSLNLI